jgi:hypothetical protein
MAPFLALWLVRAYGKPVGPPHAMPTNTAVATETSNTPTGPINLTPVIRTPAAHLPIVRRSTELVGTFVPGLPDLTILGMSITLETGGACNFTSTNLGVRVRFQNIGTAAAGPFYVEVNDSQKFVGGGLAAGAMSDLWFSNYVYSDENIAIIDATRLVEESDESNNGLALMLPIPTLPATCTPTPT